MNQNDVTVEDVKKTESFDFKNKEQWENALNDMSLEIENFREELAQKNMYYNWAMMLKIN